jgi:hypothetical protein
MIHYSSKQNAMIKHPVDYSTESILVYLEGSYTAICPELLGKPFVTTNKGSLIGTLARLLILDRYNSDRLLIIKRNGIVCFTPMRMKVWAELTISEGERSIQYCKFKEFDTSVFKERTSNE